MAVTLFQQQVYDLCSKIPSGKVSTYQEIAKALGKGGFGARAVGQALNKNPFAPQIPCHRVVSSDGSLGGFAFGSDSKIDILKHEGIIVEDNKIKNFQDHLFTFS